MKYSVVSGADVSLTCAKFHARVLVEMMSCRMGGLRKGPLDGGGSWGLGEGGTEGRGGGGGTGCVCGGQRGGGWVVGGRRDGWKAGGLVRFPSARGALGDDHVSHPNHPPATISEQILVLGILGPRVFLRFGALFC